MRSHATGRGAEGTGTMRKLMGGLLMAAGLLIAGASGLCSLWIIGVGLSETNNTTMMDDLMSGLPIVLIFGGIPFAGGIGLFIGGRYLTRSD